MIPLNGMIEVLNWFVVFAGTDILTEVKAIYPIWRYNR